MNKFKSVACLLNSSRESVIACHLVKQAGFDVIGVSLNNKYIRKDKNEWQLEYAEKAAANLLRIPWHVYTPTDKELCPFESAIKSDLEKGWEPQLDVLFHKFVTYGCVFEHAQHAVGADAYATAHYVCTDAGSYVDPIRRAEGVRLLKAFDLASDESFYLCRVLQKVLQKCIFPLGEYPLDLLEAVASSAGIPPAKHQCGDADFLRGRDAATLLSERGQDFNKKLGKVINITNNQVLGNHKGLHTYSIGKHCSIGARSCCVVHKDVTNGDLYVTKADEHPALYTDTLFTTVANWTYGTPYRFYHERQMMDTEFKTQRDEPLRPCTLTVGNMNEWCGNDHLILSSSSPMRAVTPGHFVAFYDGEECIGSAQIQRPGPSRYAMNYRKYKDLKDEAPRSNGLKSLISFFDKFIL